MITFFFQNGGKQVLRPGKAFWAPGTKKEPNVEQKAFSIMKDLGALK